MVERLLTAWLRPALTLLGLTGLLALGACGGGSGAPNNPYSTSPAAPVLSVLPLSLVAYSGVPATLSITGGTAPFQAFSSNGTVLPVSQNVPGYSVVLLPNKVSTDEVVIVTVQDATGQTRPVTVTVKAAPIFNALTFTPSVPDCGAGLCSGQNGTATVTATGPAGAPLASRQIRFDVIFGAIGILTSNPAAPVAQTLTVVTDVNGVATVGVQALANATTQPAQIQATDVTSGQRQVANFTVINSTIAGQSPLAVQPNTATITGADNVTCSTGFRVDYFIYGGNPPYTVSSTFPAGVTLTNSTVNSSGGFFEAITNGSCVSPLIFTIVDSAGKQTTASLINHPGSNSPALPAPLLVTPSTTTSAGCTGKTFNLVVVGGTGSTNITASPSGATISPQVLPAGGGTTSISGLANGSGATQITVVDTGTPRQAVSATITCS